MSVAIQGEGGEPVKWRNNAWKVKEVQQGKDLSLEDLKEDCLVHIFSFLGAGVPRNPTSEQDLAADYSEEYLARGLSPGYVIAKLTLQDAVKLHQTVALLSKRFLNLCVGRLAEMLGCLDANLILEKWWKYVPWLAHHKLRLNSLNLKSNYLHDSSILLYLMRKCDVSNLTTLEASFTDTELPFVHRMPSLVERAWNCQQLQVMGDIIDTDSVKTLGSLKEAAEDLGLPDLYTQPQVRTNAELNEEISSYCPSLTSVKVVIQARDKEQNASSSLDTLFQRANIRQLNLVVVRAPFEFNWPNRFRSWEPDTRPILEIVSALPNLKVLSLSSRDGLYGAEMEISSSSLQAIDLLNAGKNVWVTRAVCPNLKRFDCAAGRFGNGVRPRNSNGTVGTLDFDIDDSGEYIAGTTRFDGPMVWSDGRVLHEFEGLDVPDDCLVSLD